MIDNRCFGNRNIFIQLILGQTSFSFLSKQHFLQQANKASEKDIISFIKLSAEFNDFMKYTNRSQISKNVVYFLNFLSKKAFVSKDILIWFCLVWSLEGRLNDYCSTLI